jgi:phospholipase C
MGSTTNRRRFLLGTVGLAGALVAGSWRPRRALAALPPPDASGIDHVVVVTMENRSFDHFLGWLPHASGRQAGLTFTDQQGVSHATHPLAPDYQGCGHPDPDHSYQGGRVEYDGGACDGWLRAGANDDYAIGYYTRDDLAFLGPAAAGWTSLDGYFAAIMAETYPNRVYLHAGQTDRLSNTTTMSTLPTIWDRLAAAGLAGRYYYSDVPFLALWGARYAGIGRPFAALLADCAAGTLPAVAYVDPRFVDESSGTSADDHPHADVRNGEAFLSQVYGAVTGVPALPATLLVITYDEWGGFFDHVPPAVAPLPAADAALGSDGRRGFRVPALVISPWSRRRTVSSTLYDHTSILRLVEWRWGLQPLTVRDATANNLAEVLDFGARNLAAPAYAVPPGPFGSPCGGPPVPNEWAALAALASSTGWPVG